MIPELLGLLGGIGITKLIVSTPLVVSIPIATPTILFTFAVAEPTVICYGLVGVYSSMLMFITSKLKMK
jgi:hypothetical protein